MPRFASFTLKKGTMVYHGTAADAAFDALNDVAWVAKARAVADHFARLRGGHPSKKHGGSRNRVIVFRVKKDAKLLLFKDRKAWYTFLKFLHVDERYATPWIVASKAKEYHKYGDLKEYAGWFVPTNYVNGDDLLLFAPKEYLEFVREELIPRPDNLPVLDSDK